MKGESELVRTPPHRVRKLNSLAGVRAEMVSVYRASRKGEMKTEDMSRFIFALRCIAQTIQETDHEERLAASERRLEDTHAQQHSNQTYAH